MALRLTPHPTHPTHTTPQTSAPSAPGVPDPLRSRLALTPSVSLHPTSNAAISSSFSQAPASSHPLESRLSAWRATQEATKFSLLGRQYGIAEPVRRRMELADCARGEWRPAVLGGEGRGFGSVWGAGSAATGTGVHADVLLGREAEIGWEDVFVDDPLRKGVDFHGEMEGRARMGCW